MQLISMLLAASLPAAPAERSLDAGTWVRQSLTVLPVSVQECPSYESFERRAWNRLGAEIVLPMRPVARAQAHEEKAFCDQARASLVSRLSGDWSRLTLMDRFDRNDLPSDVAQNLSSTYLGQSDGAFGQNLTQTAGDTLRGLLASKALERSAHLQSDLQQNSAVATKMRTQDVTDEELALLRGSAHVLAMRATGLDVSRGNPKKGLEFSARFQTAMWGFDPVAKTFVHEGAFQGSASEISHSASGAGSSVAEGGLGFSDNYLELRPFRFTTQILSGNEGWWLRPASRFSTNTKADLVVNHRFRYMENRAVSGGSDRLVQAGYGYTDGRFPADSSWRLRHIGGIKPYSGLILEEVPGNGWGLFSVSWVNSYIDAKSDTDYLATEEPYVTIHHTSPILEFRFGARGNFGNFANNHLLFDLPVYFGAVEGSINQSLGAGQFPGDSIPRQLRAEMPTSLLWGFGLEPGWCFRVPIRRLFFTGGLQAGLRFNFIELGDERVVNESGGDYTSMYSSSQLPLSNTDIRELMNIDGTVSVRGGLEWSITPWSGLGVEVMYDFLRGEGSQSYRTGSVEKGDWTDVPGPTTGQGRLRWMFQYVWK